MGIIAANIIVGNNIVKKSQQQERSTEGSWESLRQKVHETTEIKRPKVRNEVLDGDPPPKKIREVDDTLIQYKDSAFLSDMLSSSKD